MTHAVKPVRERFATKGLAGPVVARAIPMATEEASELVLVAPPALASSRGAGGPAFPAARASLIVLQSGVSGSLIKSAGMATKQVRRRRLVGRVRLSCA
jgi:hypothetical protein